MRYQQKVLMLIGTILIVGTTACSNEERSSASGIADDAFTVSLPDAGPSNDTSAADITVEETSLPGDTVSGNDISPANDVAEAEDTGTATGDDSGSASTIPAPTITPTTAGCSPTGGDVNIYDLQNPDCADHPFPEPTGAPGIDVELKGVIVTGIYGDTFFVQEQSSGPYSGIAIFAHGIPLGSLELGMRITVNGSYSEYFGNSQIYLEDWIVQGTTNVPLPYVAEYPEHLATDGAAAEWFEGVLVRVVDVETTHTQPDCPDDYGEFEVTGDLRIDDMAYLWSARLGDQFESITGPLHYAFGNHKIEPRNAADIKWLSKGGDTAVSKCVAVDCEVNEEETGSQLIVVSEAMINPFGDDQQSEWIELYNPGSNTVSIEGWQLRDCNDQEWSITGPSLTIPPKGFLLIGPNSDMGTNGGLDIAASYGDNFYLPNSVGSILLFDGSGFQGALVDQIRYSAFSPWDVLYAGTSIERITPLAKGTVPQSWKQGVGNYGDTENQGTPGQPNTDW